MDSRINKALLKLKQEGLDALIVSKPANISYLTHSISRDSLLLLSTKQSIYFTDFRYFAETKIKLSKYFKVVKITASALTEIAGSCSKAGLKTVGFEENSLTFKQTRILKETIKDKIGLIPVSGLIESLRETKDKEELSKIRIATDITVKALQFAGSFIRPGMKEIEVAAELESFIRYNGARTSAFEIIVASGPNSSFAHHLTSQRVIKNNEHVLIDIGTDYMGYKSDLTRVFFLGKISVLARRVYSIVKRAQAKAISRIKPQAKLGEIDKASRDVIAKAGFADNFGHSLGHGVGLEIHELPEVFSNNKKLIKTGMVFSVEPAIYLPGKFGIRLEDTIVVNNKGVEVISGSLNK